MKKAFYTFASAVLFVPTFLVHAQQFQPTGGPFGTLLTNLLTFANNVLIPFIIGLGFLFFVWGMFRYFIAGGHNDDEKEKGKSLMIWATLGFVLIVIFWGIVNLVASSTGLDNDSIRNIPNVNITPDRAGP